jgi:hypothetical protein
MLDPPATVTTKPPQDVKAGRSVPRGAGRREAAPAGVGADLVAAGFITDLVMQTEDYIEDRDDFPCYRAPEEINVNEMLGALKTLHLLNRDLYLRMQAFNVSIVDQFIMDLEHDVLRKLDNEESTPMPEVTFLSAQSQMWIFAVYELLRTWRERARDAVQLFEHGGLRHKIDAAHCLADVDDKV